MGRSVQMHYNSSIPLLKKEWKPEMYFNCSNCDSPVLTTYKDIEITLEATDKNQCKLQASTHVYVWDSSAVFIPNAFTPDKSTNETFKVYGRSIKAAQIQIYNRWGEKVFESDKALEEGWDGQFKNESSPSGTYIYTVTCVALNNKIFKHQGNFVLIR
jgi:gliding motility-associated-like protein